MRQRSIRFALALVFAGAFLVNTGYSLAQAETEIRFLTHAPALGKATYIDARGNIRGKPGGGRRAFLVELVNALIAQHGNQGEAQIIEVPFARGKMIIENTTGYAFFNFMRNPEREHRFKWVGPIYSQPTYFYAYRDSGEQIASIEDARQAKAVCGIRGTNNINWLQRHGFENIFEAGSFDACLQLMIYGRVSLIQSAEIPEILLTRHIKGRPILNATGIGNHDDLLPGEDILKGYLAFNIQTPDSVIADWQAALDHIKTSGRYERLRQEYLLPKQSHSFDMLVEDGPNATTANGNVGNTPFAQAVDR